MNIPLSPSKNEINLMLLRNKELLVKAKGRGQLITEAKRVLKETEELLAELKSLVKSWRINDSKF